MDKKKLLIIGLAAVLVVSLVGVGVYKNSAAPMGNTNTPADYNGGSQNPDGTGSPPPDGVGGTQPEAGSGTKPDGTVGTQPNAGSGQQSSRPGGPPEGLSGGPMGDIAGLLGMSAEELQTKLKAGTTLEEIASGKGMTLAQLKEKLIEKEKTELDSQVSEGKITSAQAQEMLTRIQSMDLSKLGTAPEMGGAGPSGRNQQPPPSNPQQGS